MDLIFGTAEPRTIDSARSSAPGQFVELADGFVHYEIAGPPSEHTIVLVHGFFTHYYVWEPTFKAFVNAGFRVLRYDLYGRGYSDRPNTTYDRDLFDRQLANLLSALDIDQIDLVGTSMGGAIALIFTDRHPNMIRRLCLIAPSGLYSKHEKVIKLMRVPLLGELLMALQCQPKKYLNEPEVHAHLQYRGTRHAFLSTVRHGPFGDISDVYERIGKQEQKSLLIWGRDDDAIPFEVSEDVKQAIPRIEFHAIDESGHKSYYERPEKVNPLLIEFIA